MLKRAIGVATAASLALAVWGGSVFAADEPKGDVYTLSTCPLSGKPLGETPVVKAIDGREVRFCCEGCAGKSETEKEKILSKVDELVKADQAPHYPQVKCMVMEEDDLVKGETSDIVYKNRLVSFCCDDCIEDFKKDPAKFMAKLDKDTIEVQKPNYGLTTCAVSGEALGDKAIDVVLANRLVRLCCEGCKKELEKNPAKYISQVDAATKKS